MPRNPPITPYLLAERLAMGWWPGSSRPRRRRRSEPQPTLMSARMHHTLLNSEPAAHRVVMDFDADGHVIRASIIREPQADGPNASYAFGGPWPAPLS